MNTLLRKLAIWLLDLLRSKLDPEMQEEIDQYREKAKAQDKQIETVQQQVSANYGQLAALETERKELAAEVALTTLKVEKTKSKLEDLNREETNLSNISDPDILRRPL
jgi:undecaprenyl pyrophosphate synthase